jgi:hypothetical protein
MGKSRQGLHTRPCGRAPAFLKDGIIVPMIVLKKDIVRASTERLEMQTSLASY